MIKETTIVPKKMTKEEAEERIEKLRSEINHHRYLYHVLDRAEISESALDSLKHELKLLEEQFPHLVTPDSPTQRVAGKALPFFKKISHARPMLSLEDVFSREEFLEWIRRLERLGTAAFTFFGELKIDGFAVSLTYRKGLLQTGATRGDGRVGEDVTQNLRTIEALPLTLRVPTDAELDALSFSASRVHQMLTEGPLEVRGEVFMTKKAFEAINREQVKKGLPPYANPRNTAAGSVRQLDPRIAASRALDFIAYDIVGDLSQHTHAEKHLLLKLLGFKTDSRAAVLTTSDAVISYVEKLEKIRESLPWEIDGVVISVNENATYEELGVVGKAPRGAIAFKFAGKQATTVVEDIRVQVGRTGILTPVAELRPVNLSGVMIRRATLHNADEVRRLGLKVGDTVVVERAGDVIPAVVEVLTKLRPQGTREFRMPRKCPVCGALLKKEEVYVRCPNSECPAKAREYLSYFTSRKAFNIVGITEKILGRLQEEGIIADAADLFDLKKEDLAHLPRFGEKSAENIIRAVDRARRIPLARFIFSLGILHVGEETARALAGYFGSIEKVQGANAAELTEVPDVGEVVARSIYEWFRQPENSHFLEKLLAGIEVERPVRHAAAGKLKGRTFVLTGTLKTLSRERAEELIRGEGGHTASSVSAKTDYLVAGEHPGSKLEKARALGVRIIDETELKKLLS